MENMDMAIANMDAVALVIVGGGGLIFLLFLEKGSHLN